MRRVSSVAVFMWMCAALSAVALPPDQNEGRDLYVDLCASCHGVSATGNGPVEPALKVSPPDLTRLSHNHGETFPREFVIAVITGEQALPAHGSREMPVWSQCFAPRSGATGAAAVYMHRRIELIARYIESIQRRD
jgi:mono/diheme cytochrome c family protein